MKAERQQKEATPRVIQPSKGSSRHIIDNRIQALNQIRLVESIQKKENKTVFLKFPLIREKKSAYSNKAITYSDSIPLQLKQFTYRSSSTAQLSKEKSRWNKAKQGLKLGLLDGANLGLEAAQNLAYTDTPLSLIFGIPFASAAIGGLWGGISGFYSGYNIYQNGHSSQYEDELKSYRAWLSTRDEGLSDYQSGKIIEDPDKIDGMLHEGQVMYIYDVDEHLKVSGNHGPIKHAILAKNKDVYAAGTSTLQNPQRDKIEDAIGWAHTRDENLQNIINDGEKPRYRGWVDKSIKEITALGFTQDIQMKDLTRMFDEFVIHKNNSILSVTEDSGHYHPGYESGHAALEAWRKIGYPNIKWEPRWSKKKWYQQTVK